MIAEGARTVKRRGKCVVPLTRLPAMGYSVQADHLFFAIEEAACSAKPVKLTWN